ncbi:MAG: hypothetical protein JO053_10475 [Acidobacteria bacterium]|nr:hypothetical protein [Acidobacteriota bacterium]
MAVADPVSLRVAGKSILYLLLWPVSAFRFVFWQLPRVTFRRRPSIPEIRSLLESAAFGQTTLERRLQFRAAFDEYVAFHAAHDGPGPLQLLQVARHPNLGLAAACLRRKSRAALSAGMGRSREALLEITKANTLRDPEAVALLRILTEILGDGTLKERLNLDATMPEAMFGGGRPLIAGR